LAHDFWKDKWIKSPPSVSPSTFLSYYNKHTNKPFATLDLELVEGVILKSNNSSPGPDGIPFSIYRELVDITAPIILNCTKSMCKGTVTPPDDFNGGLLYLIPKKGLGVVEDTRPIVVSNADNRLIATTIHSLIILPLSDIIDPKQTGFLPSRIMNDHVLYFNEAFYGAKSKGGHYDLLLYDFAKAFDSCDHEVIFALLLHVGVPPDITRAIRLLFTDAFCHTTFPGAPPARINFSRGIKQGCPLSPLLFVLLMDVLLSLLNSVEGLENRMFADDTATGADIISLLPLARIKKIFDFFGDATGLRINSSKTSFLATRPPTNYPSIRRNLTTVGWDKVSIGASEKYLGLLIGPEVSYGDAFFSPYTKFGNRLISYLPLAPKLSLTAKIHTMNTFLTPLLSLPLSFYPFPSNYYKQFTQDTHRFVTTAKSIAFEQLCRPRRHLGLPTALIHPTYWGMALTASRIRVPRAGPSIPLSNLPLLPPPSSTDPQLRVDPLYTEEKCWELSTDLRIEIHIQRTTATCLRLGVKSRTLLSGRPSDIYQELLDSTDLLPSFKAHYKLALGKWGLQPAQVEACRAAYVALPRWIPDYALEFFFKLIHNALMTGRRLRFLDRNHEDAPWLSPDTPCPFCKVTASDSVKHYFLTCPKVRTIILFTHTQFGSPTLHLPVADSGWPPFIFLCNGRGIFHVIQLITLFAIWRLRTNLVAGLIVEDHSGWVFSFVIERLMQYAPQVINNNSFPSSLLAPPIFAAAQEATLGRGRFGAAGSRSTEQAAAARCVTDKLVSSLPPTALLVWTDGSSLGQPGPSGAGAVVCPPLGPKLSFSTALGWGTNNLGEVWAIGLGLSQAALLCSNSPSISEIHLFSDSEFAIGLCSKGWYSKVYHSYASAIRELSRQLAIPVLYHKVAAHAGILLNDEADAAAKKGALASKALAVPRTDSELKAAFSSGGFKAFCI